MEQKASMFYDRLNQFIEARGSADREEIASKSLELLEEELAHPDVFGDWIVHHFNSTAEYLREKIMSCASFSAKEYEHAAGVAKKEIELFRKYGHDSVAQGYEECLDEARFEFAEQSQEVFTIYQGDELIDENVSAIDAMDYVWSELNTEKTPIRIIDSKGREIEW